MRHFKTVATPQEPPPPKRSFAEVPGMNSGAAQALREYFGEYPESGGSLTRAAPIGAIII
jgi:hypothetical protein